MQKITPVVLRAWVDGELSEQRSAEISAVVASDSELSEQAAVFEASKLPYKAAMNQDIPPVPDALKEQVAQWSQVAGSEQGLPARRPQANYLGFFSGAVAAMLLMLMSWFGISQFNQADSVARWTQAIVNYQNFYVAETVKISGVSVDSAAKKLSVLKQNYPAFPKTPPDLASLGYHFKRIQQLDFENNPILQMVFFKEGKRPLAICLMPDTGTINPQYAEHKLLNSYVWQTGKLRAIVVAEEDSEALSKIADLVGS